MTTFAAPSIYPAKPIGLLRVEVRRFFNTPKDMNRYQIAEIIVALTWLALVFVAGWQWARRHPR